MASVGRLLVASRCYLQNSHCWCLWYAAQARAPTSSVGLWTLSMLTLFF